MNRICFDVFVTMVDINQPVDSKTKKNNIHIVITTTVRNTKLNIIIIVGQQN